MLWRLTPLSTIFQLYRGGQFYSWRKPEYPEKTTDLPQSRIRIYICKTQINIHVRFLHHRHLYLRSMSFFQFLKSASNSQIYVLFQIIKSMAVSHFLKSTSNDVTVYALTLILPPAINLTNKSAIDLRIWKGRHLFTVRYPWKQLILDWNNKIWLYIDFIFTRSLHGILTKYFCDTDKMKFLFL